MISTYLATRLCASSILIRIEQVSSLKLKNQTRILNGCHSHISSYWHANNLDSGNVSNATSPTTFYRSPDLLQTSIQITNTILDCATNLIHLSSRLIASHQVMSKVLKSIKDYLLLVEYPNMDALRHTVERGLRIDHHRNVVITAAVLMKKRIVCK